MMLFRILLACGSATMNLKRFNHFNRLLLQVKNMDGINTKTVVLNPNYYTNEHFQIISDLLQETSASVRWMTEQEINDRKMAMFVDKDDKEAKNGRS